MIKIFLFLLLFSQLSYAADVPGLTRIFKAGYNSLYQPRNCGTNIERLIDMAQRNNVNLDRAQVLKVMGGGFFETSGFYTRGNPNDRSMLGYFHFILVADNYVFDFDLHEPIVMPFQDYVRLQFSPPSNSNWMKGWHLELPGWKVSSFGREDYMRISNPKPLWEKKMSELLNVPQTLSKKRIR